MKLNNLSHPWSSVQAEQKRLKIKKNSSFVYMHNPKNWELQYIQKGKKRAAVLLPKLSVLRFTAGVNLVRANGKSVNTGVAIANAQDMGFTVIDPNKYDYIRVYPCINGKRYEDAFTEFEQLGGSLIHSFNNDKYNEFRTMLMRDGYLNLPHEHFIKLMIQENSKVLNKYAQLQHNPNHEALYQKALKKDTDLKQALEDLKKEGVEVYG